ncbi:MAG: hypothetical protein NVSMB37_4740 [Candidatus Saccharimonadales bacterium]
MEKDWADIMPEQSLAIVSSQDTLQLQSLIRDDAPTLFAIIDADREHLTQYGEITSYLYTTPDDIVASIERPTNLQRIRFAMWDQRQIVGSISLTLDGFNGGELGYWVGGEHIGHNYATRATKLLTNYAFTTLDLDALYAEVHPHNYASRRTLEKNDFIIVEKDYAMTYVLHNPNRTHLPRDVDQVLTHGNVSMAIINLNGYGDLIRNHASDTRYLIGRGAAMFSVETMFGTYHDSVVLPGQSIFIPCGQAYRDVGKATMLAVNCPAFDAAAVERL